MGSTDGLPDFPWILIAVGCAILYLIFDALRSFALQVSPVAVRRLLNTEGEHQKPAWARFEIDDFQFVSGAVLQIGLVVGLGATVIVYRDQTLFAGVLASVLIWSGLVLLWKLILVLVPEHAGEQALGFLIPVARATYFLVLPILYPVRKAMGQVGSTAEDDEKEEEVSDAQVQAYIDVGEEEGIIEASEGRLLQSIVDFGDRLAHEIMTPRIDVLAFDARRPLDELAKLFTESKYARIPTYEESIDHITGIVHVKDLFEAILRNEKRSVAELARPPYFVSETKKVSELLRELQSEHLQIAIVVDEYGGTAGIITTEDVIEEIVGEIADEHEDEEATIVDLDEGAYLVSGLLRVEDLEEKLEATLQGEDYETVAGLIFTTLGRVPAAGTVLSKNGYRFEVDRADRRRIYRVKVSKEPEALEIED